MQKLLVIAPDGVQIGELELKKALIVAEQLDLDLVEVSPESKPPVARLMDYGKYKYELAQKAKESRKKQVKISVKEIQLKPKIDTHDFKIKLNKSRKFLDSGDKVKFTMRFRGRVAEHPEFGQKVLDNYIEELSDIAMVESTSNPDGKSLTMVMAPMGEKNEEKNPQEYEKRVKVTGTGKYMRRRSHRSHYKLAKSSGTWKRLKEM